MTGAAITLAGVVLCATALPLGAQASADKAEQVRLSVFEISRAPSAPTPMPNKHTADRADRPNLIKEPLRQSAAPLPVVSAAVVPEPFTPQIVTSTIQTLTLPPVAPPTAPSATSLKRNDDARNAYAALLWQRIADKRPSGLHIPGAAALIFTLDKAGRLKSVNVEQASGSGLLDRIAVQTVRRAAPFPPPPTGLDDLTFSVSFHFD